MYNTIINDDSQSLGLVNKALVIGSSNQYVSEVTSLSTLSSFKLLAILRLEQNIGGQLSGIYIEKIEAELLSRGDNQYWCSPH